MFANPHRSEVAIRLAGTPAILRATFGAIQEIEVGCNRGILQLFAMLPVGNLRLTELAVIVAAGLRAYGDQECKPEEAGARVHATGYAEVCEALAPFLEACVTGKVPDPKKAEDEKKDAKPGEGGGEGT